MSIRAASVVAFQPAADGRRHRADAAPEPGRGGGPDGLPDREWSLSAVQVVAVVAAIIALSELFALAAG